MTTGQNIAASHNVLFGFLRHALKIGYLRSGHTIHIGSDRLSVSAANGKFVILDIPEIISKLPDNATSPFRHTCHSIFTSFYFRNFLERISLFVLKKCLCVSRQALGEAPFIEKRPLGRARGEQASAEY